VSYGKILGDESVKSDDDDDNDNNNNNNLSGRTEGYFIIHNLSKDDLFPYRDAYRTYLEYKPSLLPLAPTYSVK
jgi:hypothetical protein